MAATLAVIWQSSSETEGEEIVGWWIADAAELRNAGAEDAKTQPMWGDLPADTFGEAVDEIVAQFQESLGRKPTKAELREGLEFTLSAYQEDMDR